MRRCEPRKRKRTHHLEILSEELSSPAVPRRKRKARGAKRPAQHRKWFSSYYRITLSARASTLGGIVRPICLAAFRLMINSNFVGCSTGRSAGFAPFRILSTYVAPRRYKSVKLI